MFFKQRNAYKYVSRDDEDKRSFKMGRDSIPQKILKVLFADLATSAHSQVAYEEFISGGTTT